jgi:transcriptional regulator with XRE-family HTH domain
VQDSKQSEPTDDFGIVAKRLRLAREAAGLSQRELGVRAGLDASVASPRINQYERGKHVPNTAVLGQVGKQLNVPVAYFYAGDDDLALFIVRYHRASGTQRIKLAEEARKIFGVL